MSMLYIYRLAHFPGDLHIIQCTVFICSTSSFLRLVASSSMLCSLLLLLYFSNGCFFFIFSIFVLLLLHLSISLASCFFIVSLSLHCFFFFSLFLCFFSISPVGVISSNQKLEAKLKWIPDKSQLISWEFRMAILWIKLELKMKWIPLGLESKQAF